MVLVKLKESNMIYTKTKTPWERKAKTFTNVPEVQVWNCLKSTAIKCDNNLIVTFK